MFKLPVAGSHCLCLKHVPARGRQRSAPHELKGGKAVDLWTCRSGSALDAGSWGVSPTGRFGEASEEILGYKSGRKGEGIPFPPAASKGVALISIVSSSFGNNFSQF